MKKIILMGRSGSGKTTLTQALKGQKITYHKTQYICNYDVVIDTPGEYAQTHALGHALALYAWEADVVGLCLASTEQYSLYPPCITCMVNRDVIGIVTRMDDPDGKVERAETWLRLSGCTKIFHVNSIDGTGVAEILEYLKEDADNLPWKMTPDMVLKEKPHKQTCDTVERIKKAT